MALNYALSGTATTGASGATSTYQTYLLANVSYSANSLATAEAYNILCDIIDFPDMGGAPETLDTTTLSDSMKTSILGIQENESKTFNTNYDEKTFAMLRAFKPDTDYKFALAMGANGEHGVWTWTGRLSAYVTGGGVNEVRKMAITISPSSTISYATTIPALS